MKLLLTSDWHLDAFTAGVARFDDVAGAITETVDAAIEEDVDAFVFTGDLADPPARSHRAVEWIGDHVVRRLEAAKKKILMLPGNHDVIDDGSGTSTLSALKRFSPICDVVDRPRFGFYQPLNAYVICLPFVPRSHGYDPEEFVGEAAADYKEHGKSLPVLVFGHLNIAGITPGSETYDMPRGRDVFLPLDALWKHFKTATIFNGHYHAQQCFEIKRTKTGVQKVYIPGSLERLTFGEESNEPGYILAEVNHG